MTSRSPRHGAKDAPDGTEDARAWLRMLTSCDGAGETPAPRPGNGRTARRDAINNRGRLDTWRCLGLPSSQSQKNLRQSAESADRKTTIAAEDGGAPRHNAAEDGSAHRHIAAEDGGAPRSPSTAAKRSLQSNGSTIQKSLRGCWTAQADFV